MIITRHVSSKLMLSLISYYILNVDFHFTNGWTNYKIFVENWSLKVIILMGFSNFWYDLIPYEIVCGIKSIERPYLLNMWILSQETLKKIKWKYIIDLGHFERLNYIMEISPMIRLLRKIKPKYQLSIHM